MKSGLCILFIAALFYAEAAPCIPQTVKETNSWEAVKISIDPKNFEVSATFIFWTAREAGSDCWAEVITSEGLASSNVLEAVHFGWDPGFRVGAGYTMMHDRWDTQIHYTWFNTQGTDSISSLPGAVHSSFLGNFYVNNPSGSGLSGPSYQKASIVWSIHFDMFDWELGRNFQASKSMAFRPFLGIKGGWIYQSIDTKWENPALSGAEFYSVGIENLKNNFWGLGPQAGINTKWRLLTRQNRSFYLFGDFSGAIMWGHWSFGDVFDNDIQEKIVVNFDPVNSGASMLRSFMGFGWESSLRQHRSHFSLKFGYEAQFWLDQLQFYAFTAGRLSNTLTLQGGTFEFSFDY